MLSSIHLLRGLAALSVVLYHIYFISKIYMDYSIDIINYLHGGVDVFFVISGFIMYYVVTKAPDTKGYTSKFLKDRFFRIVPLYWFFTISFYLVALSFFYGDDFDLSLSNLVMSLLFLPYGEGDVGFSYPVLGVGWTLIYEVYFYFLVFLSIKFYRKSFDVFLICILLFLVFVGTLIKFLNFDFGSIFFAWTDYMLLEFAFGILLAKGYFKYRVSLLKFVSLYILVLFVLSMLFIQMFSTITVMEMQGFGNFYRVFTIGTVAASIVALLLLVENQVSLLQGQRFFIAFGASSYMLYLLHHPLLSLIGKVYFKFLNNDSLVVFYVLSLFICYSIALIMNSLYDKYCFPKLKLYFF